MEKMLIIIPYFNEFSNLLRIRDFCSFFEKNERIDVLVAFNGCTDETVEYLNNECCSFDFIFLNEGSKVKAINSAIEERFYSFYCVLDADVVVNPDSFNYIIDFLSSNKIEFATLSPILVVNRSSWLVKNYYKFLQNTAEFNYGMVSAGVYIFSHSAKIQIFPFPDLISDDGYIKSKLKNSIFYKFENVNSEVMCPEDYNSLLKIKTRSHLGNLQLNKSGLIGVQSRNSKKNIFLAAFKAGFLSMVIYLITNLISKIKAKKLYSQKIFLWERDESTR